MNVLFVCSGNTCRSPFAEGLARRLAAGSEHEFSSAGEHALAGMPCPAEAVAVAGEHGVDLSAHRARRPPAVADPDGLVVRLHSIPDPFGGGPDAYRAAYREIAAVVESVLAELER